MIRPPDATSPIPLFTQISDQLRWQISVGALRPGTPLPATRDAATAWRVHRHTVGRAYRELRDAGLVTAGANGRLVVAGVSVVPETESPGVDSFLRETLEVARDQLGLSPVALVAALRTRAGADLEHARACVIECSQDQCDDLKRQVESHWRVSMDTFCLDDPGEPPAVPIVATLFHYDEIRERWPRRLAEIRFVAAGLHPIVADLVEHVAGGIARPEVALLVLEDAVAGLSLVEEIETLLGARYPVRLEVLAHRSGAPGLPAADVVIATPAAWARLDASERSRLDVIRLRYAIDNRDLGALGIVHGWSARPPAVALAHTP